MKNPNFWLAKPLFGFLFYRTVENGIITYFDFYLTFILKFYLFFNLFSLLIIPITIPFIIKNTYKKAITIVEKTPYSFSKLAKLVTYTINIADTIVT